MKQPEKIDAEMIRKGIIDSFAMSKYPGDSLLVHLDPNEDWDSGEIFERLQNKSWQDLLFHLENIDGPELYWYCWIYTMLTPESFYYYLPAFLIVAMDLRRSDTVGRDLLFNLDPHEPLRDVYWKQFINDVIKQLSAEQRVAMQNWARYLLQEYPDDIEAKDLQHWL